MSQFRTLYTTILLWDDDSNWKGVLIDLINDPGYEVFWIRHDSDKSKVHRHVVIKGQNGQTSDAIAKRFGVDPRNVRSITKKDERTGGINAFCKYLLHNDRKSRMLGKHIYRIDSFVGPDRLIGVDKAAKFAAEPDEYGLADIMAFIKSKLYVSMEDVVSWCCTYQCLSVLRRYQSIVRTLINEHNAPLHHMEYVADIDRRISQLEGKVNISAPAALVGVNMDLIYEALGKKNDS